MLWKCSPIVTRLKNKKDINVQKYKIIYKKITKVKKFKKDRKVKKERLAKVKKY